MMKNKLLHNNDFIRVFVLLKRITEDFVSKVADSGGGYAWGEHAFNYIICRKGNDTENFCETAKIYFYFRSLRAFRDQKNQLFRLHLPSFFIDGSRVRKKCKYICELAKIVI